VYDGNAGEALLPLNGSCDPRSAGALKALLALKSSLASNVGGSSAGAAGGGGHEFSSAVGTDGGGGGGKLPGVEGGRAERRGVDGAALRGDEGGTLRGDDGAAFCGDEGGTLRGADGGAALRAVGIDGGGGALLDGGGGGKLRPVICGVGGGGGTRLRAAAFAEGGGGGGLLGRDVSGAASAARLGGASAAPPDGANGGAGARLGGGGGALEPGPRATTPDSEGRAESRLLSESKISSPEPLLLPLMEENHETTAAVVPVPLAWDGDRYRYALSACLRTGAQTSNGAWRQSASTSVRTALRAMAYVAGIPSTRA
jgi:hypothetical protein